MFYHRRTASLPPEKEEQKTNEFQARRRLRLQQVRAQSKDLARVVRERASRERLRQFDRADQDKKEDYIQRQTKLVERLEKIHADNLNCVGFAHYGAVNISEKEKCDVKSPDRSKERGKVAAEELKKLKQKELDKKKDQLVRKLAARNRANERSRVNLNRNAEIVQDIGSGDQPFQNVTESRDKLPHNCNASGDEISQNYSNRKTNALEPADKCVGSQVQVVDEATQKSEVSIIREVSIKKDMETQWSLGDHVKEWMPDNIREKGVQSSITDEKGKNSKKQPNLFEVSEEMPLMGSIYRMSQHQEAQSQPSLTLVSEFLQTRDHRLQKPTPGFYRVNDYEIRGLRESLYKNKREDNDISKGTTSTLRKSPVSAQNVNPSKKKPSILHYNHITKISKDLPLESDSLVERVTDKDLDAYSLAVKESAEAISIDRREEEVRHQRSREAVNKLRIAEEYKDTMNFLQNVVRNSDKNKPIDIAYMDDYQQNKKRSTFQKKLEQEFKKVQSASKPKTTVTSQSSSVARNPVSEKSSKHIKPAAELTKEARSSLSEAERLLNELKNTVPKRADSSFRILNNQEENGENIKNGNTVTFDFTPSTYTYTPRIKHTPPTKDRHSRSEKIEKVEIQNINVVNSDSSDNTALSNCSSDYDIIVQKRDSLKSKKVNEAKSEVRKFVVYKIKDSSDEVAVEKVKSKHRSKEKSAKIKFDGDAESQKENCKSKKEDSDEIKKPVNKADSPMKGPDESDHAADCGDLSKNLTKSQEKSSKSSEKSKKLSDLNDSASHGDSGKKEEICNKEIQKTPNKEGSNCTFSSTFKTSAGEQPTAPTCSGGYIKVLDEAGAEAGKIFIGTSNVIPTNPYEVVIQLKKKIGDQSDKGVQSTFIASQEVTSNSNSSQASENLLNTKTPVREMRFSSSSSTVYLSPPDMILPEFLKPAYRFAEGNIVMDSINPTYGNNCSKNIPSEKKSKTKCHINKCSHSQKIPISKSSRQTDIYNKSKLDIDSVKKLYPCSKSVDVGKTCQKQAQNQKSSKKLSGKYNFKTNEMASNCNFPNTRKLSDAQRKLNPSVQNYIKELLEMSEHSKKTIEFSALHCSAISTPGSSVVNVPTNKNPKTIDSKEVFIESEINRLIKRELIKQIYKLKVHSKSKQTNMRDEDISIQRPLSSSQTSNSLTFESGIGDVPSCQSNKRQTKHRPVHRHKVKSLNISRNIMKYFKTIDPEERVRSVFYKKCGTKITTSDVGPQTKNKKRRPGSRDCKYGTAAKYNMLTRSVNKAMKNNITERHLSGPTNDNKFDKTTKKYSSAPNIISTATTKNDANDVSRENTEGKVKAGNKLNMTKIADLTEKCTKRLLNLAKLLDEVKKNKPDDISCLGASCKNSSKSSCDELNKIKVNDEILNNVDLEKQKVNLDSKSTNNNIENVENTANSCEFVSVLGDIPKPEIVQKNEGINSENLQNNDNVLVKTMKRRSKPPPALSRVNLRNEDVPIAHELSTVLEVDSPLSTKNISSRYKGTPKSQVNTDEAKSSEKFDCKGTEGIHDSLLFESSMPPQGKTNSFQNKTPAKLGISNLNVHKNSPRASLPMHIDISEISKLEIYDLKRLKKVRIEPFISLDDYARQYRDTILEDISNPEDATKLNLISNRDEEHSSLNSDGTLPDIVQELLARNILSKPFSFEEGSNLELNALSSESSISIHPLRKCTDDPKKVKKDCNFTFDSSKNDLEKDFKNIGIGWASSTLKKTKETLAYSTSTSSLSSKDHSNRRKVKKHDTPTKKSTRPMRTVKSSTSQSHSAAIQWIESSPSALPNSENKENICDLSVKTPNKCVEMQTSVHFHQPATVTDFLINTLADKTTFSYQTPSQKEEEHFTSLHSTKLTVSIGDLGDKQTIENDLSKQNARQRTSTPVQLFKSLTYNNSSTSSYNNSNNVLFSNIDEISSVKNSSTSDKDELTVPNISLRMRRSKSNGSCDSEQNS